MPYNRRTYNKRSYMKKRFNKKSFSKYNTYKYRSSKAQANQIYRLNKKVNSIYKSVKPDIQYFDTKATDISEPTTTAKNGLIKFTNMFELTGWLNGNNPDGTPTGIQSFNSAIESLQPGSEKIRFLNGVLNLQFSKGKSSSLFTGTYGYTGPLTVDVYILQKRGPESTNIIASLFSSTFGNNHAELFNNAPLTSGIWKYFYFLKHKRYTLNKTIDTSYQARIKFYPKIKTINTVITHSTTSGESTENDSSTQGKIYVVYKIWADSQDVDAHFHLNYACRFYFSHA